MAINLASLTTVAECDALSAILSQEKDDVQLRLLQAEKSQRSYKTGGANIKAELQSLDAQIAAWDVLIPSLPDGEVKVEQERLRRAADYRRFVLQGRQGDFSLVALAMRDLDVAHATNELAETEAAIAAVEARKLEL